MNIQQLLDCPLVIFLDIDGVLNSDEYNPKGDDGYSGIAPYHVRFLNEILDQTGACIVISSSWRCSHTTPKPYEYAIGALEEAGMNRGVVRGMTPVLTSRMREDPYLRSREIDQWLSQNPNVNNYCIIDDQHSFTPDQMEHLVRTYMGDGLCEGHVKEAVDILLDKAYN